MIERLDNTVMPYAWGSRSVIAELTGRASPSSDPEAELWMGAHPIAPSRTAGSGRTLADVVAAAPEGVLGPEVARAFEGRLPFLLKVLAAEQPLSLQAHPTSERAREGFAEEERAKIPRDAGHRNYKDASHKPELLCALGPFDALCGFRSAKETVALFDALAVSELDAALTPLRRSPDATGIRGTFEALMRSPEDRRGRMVAATVAACRAHDGAFEDECAWAVRIAALYPGDIGVVSALMLNLVHLAPGEAIYLGAGNLHAYLRGPGVEIMASSDNVLRGGLTKKHVDVGELLRVLDFADGPVPKVLPRAVDAHEKVYDTEAREFRLSVLEVSGELERDVRGPEILLVTSGAVDVSSGASKLALARGASAFVSAEERRLRLTGQGVVYRAAVNLG